MSLSTTLDKELIIKTISENGNKESSQILNTSRDMIGYYRKVFKIQSPTPTGGQRKFSINHSFFSSIDSEAKAYSIGFIAADGNVLVRKYGHYLSITLKRSDRDILDKISSCMDSTYPVKEILIGAHSGYPGSTKEQIKFQVSSKQLCFDLISLGITPNKSKTVVLPIMDEAYYRHMLRGFLEGDGWVTKDSFGICSNYYCLSSIKAVLERFGFETPAIGIANNYPRLLFSARYHEILKWMYSDSSISLDRKLNLFNLFWKDRVYKKPNRQYKPRTNERLLSYLDSVLVVEPSTYS